MGHQQESHDLDMARKKWEMQQAQQNAAPQPAGGQPTAPPTMTP